MKWRQSNWINHSYIVFNHIKLVFGGKITSFIAGLPAYKSLVHIGLVIVWPIIIPCCIHRFQSYSMDKNLNSQQTLPPYLLLWVFRGKTGSVTRDSTALLRLVWTVRVYCFMPWWYANTDTVWCRLVYVLLAMLCVISCYVVPRFNGTWLYIVFDMECCLNW